MTGEPIRLLDGTRTNEVSEPRAALGCSARFFAPGQRANAGNAAIASAAAWKRMALSRMVDYLTSVGERDARMYGIETEAKQREWRVRRARWACSSSGWRISARGVVDAPEDSCSLGLRLAAMAQVRKISAGGVLVERLRIG